MPETRVRYIDFIYCRVNVNGPCQPIARLHSEQKRKFYLNREWFLKMPNIQSIV